MLICIYFRQRLEVYFAPALIVCYDCLTIDSSSGQIRNQFVCLSVSQSVTVCHTKRVKRSTDRNPPSIFAKLATMVESLEMWLPIVLVEIRKTHFRQTGSGINFHHCPHGKIALMSSTGISKTLRYHDGGQ